MMHPHDSGCTLTFFFDTVKEAKRYIKIILMVLVEKFSFAEMAILGPTWAQK